MHGCATRGGPAAGGTTGVSHRTPRLTSQGDVVFYAAGVAVVSGAPAPENEDDAPPDDAATQQRFFVQHTDDITTLAMHPNGSTVATGRAGGRHRRLAEPNVRSGRTLRGFHELGIGSLDFSPDGTLLYLSASMLTSVAVLIGRQASSSSGRNTQAAVACCRWGSAGCNVRL